MTSDSVSGFAGRLGSTVKSLVKILLQSRRCTVKKIALPGEKIIVLGNGPSLSDTIRECSGILTQTPCMAVNFAANAPEYTNLKPRYYVLADPHFFSDSGDPNVVRLYDRLNGLTEWDMTLFVPATYRAYAGRIENKYVKVETFNPVGVEGFQWLENAAYSAGWGMPRPRNVLIPAIMIAILLGYKEIYIAGADHSWMKTLSVDEQNRVVSVQPHFYKDNDDEKARVTSVYTNYRLHDIVNSFYVAFKAYHDIARYAQSHDIRIYNSTPESFIDAFERRPLQ